MTTEKNTIDDLLKTHGKRIQPDDLMKKRAMKNVKSHWQAKLKRQQTQQKQRHKILIRIAASVLLVTTVVFLMQSNLQEHNPQILKDFYVNGEVQVSRDGKTWEAANQHDFKKNIWIKTNDNSFANLTLLDNSQIRLNHNSQIQVFSASQITLHNGAIYHDADNINTTNPLLITTSLGNIQHIGTRYMVNKTDIDLKVSVRNGIVKVSHDAMSKTIASGKQLLMNSTGKLQEIDITPYDSMWHWTHGADKPFQSEGKSLHDFIVWYAHENGYDINWNTLQNKTKKVRLTGNVSGLAKSQQIKAIFLSTKFDYKINQGILSIL
ncbi:MAG: FecR domain-containing protein [Marinicellaceae bacterium]